MAEATGKRIAYIHRGNSWQLRSFQDFRHYLDDLIYIHDLSKVDLSSYAAVVMPDAMDVAAALPHAQQHNGYLYGGGFLVVCLQGHSDWLDIPGLEWTPGNCRDWLWWTKGERLEVRFSEPHNGQRFMPATTRFLQSFYPWLNRELGIERPLRNRFTYLQCSHVPSEWHPEWIEESLGQAGFETQFNPLYQLGPELLGATNTIYLGSSHDEFF